MLKYSSRLISANGRSRDKDFPDIIIYNDATGSTTRGNYVVEMYNAAGKVYRRGFVRNFPRKRLGSWELLRQGLNDIHERYKHDQTNGM